MNRIVLVLEISSLAIFPEIIMMMIIVAEGIVQETIVHELILPHSLDYLAVLSFA